MPTRPIAALLVLAALAYACGPHASSSEPARQRDARDANEPPIASSLGVEVAERVGFAFHVTNNDARRLELTFPSGQTHDIVVLDSIGREVWRWSEGRMFTQALQNKILASAETLTYQADWNPGKLHGRYTAVASLMSENHPLEQRVEFAVP
ncbi:MAG TPA: BsuPI-related putative proteinase inhibitor [Gemmatimonadaceae bacterium]|nr:BsuPI-related putative proteinase inhibitor [Gemmatimonadaceae bacterium]